MNSKLLVLCALVAVVAAAPQDVQILRYDNDNDGLGKYRFAYEQSDGSKREENGELVNPGAENEYLAMRGSYSWVGPDGVTYTVTYVADENGFQPTIEQGPGGSVPPGIVASLLDIYILAMKKINAPPLNTGEIVLSAIKNLTKNTAWTTRTITKFIKKEFKITDSGLGPKVSRALKKGVRIGLLQMDSGRFRLNDMSRLVKQVTPEEINMRLKGRQKARPLHLRSRTPSPSRELNKIKFSRKKY